MAAKNLGLTLARLLKQTHTSAQEAADSTGATRATVYNWISGKGVSPAYRTALNKLITKLQARKIK